MTSTWNGLRRSPMPPRKTAIKRRAFRRPALPAAVRRRVLALGPCVYRLAGNCYGRMQVEHVVPVALRRVHKIAHDDERFLFPSCSGHNARKYTLRLAPVGFDLSILPGKGWREWDGGAIR